MNTTFDRKRFDNKQVYRGDGKTNRFFDRRNTNDRRNISDCKFSIINIGRVALVTDKGRKPSYSVLIAASNNPGYIGLGRGKSAELGDAIKNAENKAKNNIEFVIRKPRSTILYSIKGKLGSTSVLLKPAEGIGIRSGAVPKMLCEMAGIKHVTCKIIGSRNKSAVAAATIEAFKKLETIKQIAYRRGLTPEKISADRYSLISGKEIDVNYKKYERKNDTNKTVVSEKPVFYKSNFKGTPGTVGSNSNFYRKDRIIEGTHFSSRRNENKKTENFKRGE